MRRRELLRHAAATSLTWLCGCPARSPSDGAPATGEKSDAGGSTLASYGPGASQFGELRVPALPSGRTPVVIVIHGGFWRAGYDLDLMERLCDVLGAVGLATWNIEYRRVGEPGGGWPGTLLDVGAAADALRGLAAAHPIDVGRVAALGHSAGGHLALWLAARRRLPNSAAAREIASGAQEGPLPLRGAVSLAGVLDLIQAQSLGLGAGAVAELLGGSPEAYPDRYVAASPRALLPLGVGQALVDGRDDAIVPASLGDAYAQAARQAGDAVSVTNLEDIGHFEPIDPASSAWPAVRDATLAMVGAEM